MRGGYSAIGMDHFALSTDPMTKAYQSRSLTRNFQGYSIQLAEDMIGFGLTAIGFFENGYFQNRKDLIDYQTQVAKGHLPVGRGYILNDDDILRRRAIQSVMCHFEIDKKEFGHLANLQPLIAEGF